MKRDILAALTAALLFIAPGARALELATGIDDPVRGLDAYGDAWHWCFWRSGLEAGQISSHDERDRNIDLMHFHGVYRGDPVLARIEGPGVLYRLWSAGPTGKLKFYADGSNTPAVSCGFKDYMVGACSAESVFYAGRHANYTPFYFEKSLVITARGMRAEGAYYQATYMRFQDAADLKTMDESMAKAYPEKLEKAARFWESRGAEPARDPGGYQETVVADFDMLPGKRGAVRIAGAGLITKVRVLDEDDPWSELSDLEMRVYYDGLSEPAVDSPVDAFFGNRFDSREKSGQGPYETLMIWATEAGYVSRFPMPFADGFKLEIENEGDVPRRVMVEIEYRKVDRLPDAAMRFHAEYREMDYPDVLSRDKLRGLLYRVDQGENYTVLDREGKGYYVGCFLYVASLGTDWWGEGDEMIWVDGDSMALIRGTGTEDEFNWSFGFEENRSALSGALQAARPEKGSPQSAVGHNALYRFRLGDYVPFQESIRVTFERWGSTTEWMKRYPGAMFNLSHSRGDDYRSVAFWYELPSHKD